MDFDIVIATRNRQQVLKRSLPLMLSQTRPPRRVIIVDSSDDHTRTEGVLSTLIASVSPRIDFQLYSTMPGTSYQRNFGLKQVRSPVVVMPDDDSMWFPGSSEALLRIYEQDKEGAIGAVGGEESFHPPPHFDGREVSRTGRDDALRPVRPTNQRTKRIVNRLEYTLFPDPFFIEALTKYKNRPSPQWLSQENAVFSATMTGFRMSFRTKLIKNIGFDEILGQYALFEDHDACLGILRTHAIARARNAPVFHEPSPGRRAAPAELGMMHILNRAYIIYKHSAPDSPARRSLPRFSLYKLLRYLPGVWTQYDRKRFLGALKAFSLLPRLEGVTGEELRRRYTEVRCQCLSWAFFREDDEA